MKIEIGQRWAYFNGKKQFKDFAILDMIVEIVEVTPIYIGVRVIQSINVIEHCVIFDTGSSFRECKSNMLRNIGPWTYLDGQDAPA